MTRNIQIGKTYYDECDAEYFIVVNFNDDNAMCYSYTTCEIEEYSVEWLSSTDEVKTVSLKSVRDNAKELNAKRFAG